MSITHRTTTAIIGGGGGRVDYVIPDAMTDEDLLAAVWFMLLRNPYE